MKVTFKDVGSRKLTWEAETKVLDFAFLFRQLKSKGAILSRGVDFTYDEETKTGEIWVGDVRLVGRFEVSGDDLPWVA